MFLASFFPLQRRVHNNVQLWNASSHNGVSFWPEAIKSSEGVLLVEILNMASILTNAQSNSIQLL